MMVVQNSFVKRLSEFELHSYCHIKNKSQYFGNNSKSDGAVVHTVK
jgi:hypothetical protein